MYARGGAGGLGRPGSQIRRRDEGRVRHGCGGRGSSVGFDRKSTRLNSSHLVISYAVFCFKNKKPFGDSRQVDIVYTNVVVPDPRDACLRCNLPPRPYIYGKASSPTFQPPSLTNDEPYSPR